MCPEVLTGARGFDRGQRVSVRTADTSAADPVGGRLLRGRLEDGRNRTLSARDLPDWARELGRLSLT